MNVDRGSFLILVTTLAAGTAGGYFLAEKHVVPHLDEWGGKPPPPPPPPPASASVKPPEPVVVDAGPVDAGPPPPTCSDDAGAPGVCPPPGYPVHEGGCGSYAAMRCEEYKRSMKPRVSTAAVDCLNKLTPQERCDPKRIDLCGHLALMNACQEPETAVESGGKENVASLCKAIVVTCGKTVVPTSVTDCQRTLSGLTDNGRDLMVQCMKKHCSDRSFLGCEAVPQR